MKVDTAMILEIAAGYALGRLLWVLLTSAVAVITKKVNPQFVTKMTASECSAPAPVPYGGESFHGKHGKLGFPR
jgi:hypothetical protein